MWRLQSRSGLGVSPLPCCSTKVSNTRVQYSATKSTSCSGMPMRPATRRASSRSRSAGHSPPPASSRPSQLRMNTPTTRTPAARSRSAATAESTPPLSPTATVPPLPPPKICRCWARSGPCWLGVAPVPHQRRSHADAVRCRGSMLTEGGGGGGYRWRGIAWPGQVRRFHWRAAGGDGGSRVARGDGVLGGGGAERGAFPPLTGLLVLHPNCKFGLCSARQSLLVLGIQPQMATRRDRAPTCAMLRLVMSAHAPTGRCTHHRKADMPPECNPCRTCLRRRMNRMSPRPARPRTRASPGSRGTPRCDRLPQKRVSPAGSAPHTAGV
mmetsp:Transcript_13949/g.35235  ORF Transcript_13949/g.35235 Transcript_13949/m.35235 type:complete len:325 (+) Transcript_13949:1948-2922(+)